MTPIQCVVDSPVLQGQRFCQIPAPSLLPFLQELREENRTLRRQLRRHDLELNRLEGTQGELPTILHAHNEEVRALKIKLKKVGGTKQKLSFLLRQGRVENLCKV